MSKLKRKDYEELLVPLQEELAALARWLGGDPGVFAAMVESLFAMARWCCSTAAGTTAPASRR